MNVQLPNPDASIDTVSMGAGTPHRADGNPVTPSGTIGERKPAPKREDLLNLIRLEGLLNQLKDSTITATVSTCAAFLERSGFSPGATVAGEFIDGLDKALKEDTLESDGFADHEKALDRAYRSRLATLVRIHHALAVSDFPALLRQYLSSCGLSYAALEKEFGKPRHWLANTLARHCGGVTGISVSEAKRLDEILNAGGNVFAAFLVLSQHTAFEPITSAKRQLLHKPGFAGRFRQLRGERGLTLLSIARQIERMSGMHVWDSTLSHWEQGYALPSQGMGKAVEAIDAILCADKGLLKAWMDEKPKTILPGYSIPYEEWPEYARKQFDRLADYKGTNPEGLEHSPAPTGDRWTGAKSRLKCVETLERFFGCLNKEKSLPISSFSLSLIADWELVSGFFDFIRLRTQRESYSQESFVMASVFYNLCRWFLPHLADNVENEDYWKAKLPTHGTGIDDRILGVPRPYEFELSDFSDRWEYQLHETRIAIRAFLKEDHFEFGSLIGRAADLLEADVEMEDILAVVRELARTLPTRILCRRAAIRCRQLAVAALVLARGYRPGTLRAIKDQQIVVQASHAVWLNLKEDQFKTRGRGGSAFGALGQLPDDSFLHEVVIRYKREARPILLGGSAKDAGYFLTPSRTRVPDRPDEWFEAGRQLDEETIRCDAHAILGYHPYAQRYLFANEAWRKNGSREDIANVLLNTPPVLDRYIRTNAGARAKRLNAIAHSLLFGDDGV